MGLQLLICEGGPNSVEVVGMVVESKGCKQLVYLSSINRLLYSLDAVYFPTVKNNLKT
jgi:hypothetical protein